MKKIKFSIISLISAAPIALIPFLPQSWGFYGGNATETVVVRYRYNFKNGHTKYVLEDGIKAPIPYRFVIGGSEGLLANNTNGMGTRILKYYCKNPHPGISDINRITLEVAKVTFPRMDKPIPPNQEYTGAFTEAYHEDCL